MRAIVAGVFVIGLAVSGVAQAEVADQKIRADSSPEVTFRQLELAASRMCAKAARTDRVVNEAQCVNTLIAYALAEADRPMLTAVALRERPAIASIRVHLPADMAPPTSVQTAAK